MKSSDLISEFKYGNDLDIEKIISQYSNYVYIIIKNMNSNYLKEEDIEEVVSEVFFCDLEK